MNSECVIYCHPERRVLTESRDLFLIWKRFLHFANEYIDSGRNDNKLDFSSPYYNTFLDFCMYIGKGFWVVFYRKMWINMVFVFYEICQIFNSSSHSPSFTKEGVGGWLGGLRSYCYIHIIPGSFCLRWSPSRVFPRESRSHFLTLFFT